MTNVLEWAFTDVTIQLALITLKVKQSADIGDFVPGSVTFCDFLGLGNATQTAYPLLLLIFFIGNTSKASLTSLSHCLLDLHPSLFPSTFSSALATKNSNQYSYRVFFSEFLPSLFLEILHRTA